MVDVAAEAVAAPLAQRQPSSTKACLRVARAPRGATCVVLLITGSVSVPRPRPGARDPSEEARPREGTGEGVTPCAKKETGTHRFGGRYGKEGR